MEREPGEQENSQSQHSEESRDSSCPGQTSSLLPSVGGMNTPDPSTTPCSGGPPPRQNNVGNVILHGVPIVSLVIDDKERLCLAQISNTLLKDYSYNEIHNRRVALGITCVQCTPVQLEILRRAGAMPVSSRRCGMITKREAERLVKSFLEDNSPPKLPEDFAFSVYHECGWGCRGFFEPSRYNSSRAKCIKCAFCSVYFSPNKFIFHYHRTPEAKYHHPDAANFNSWRRHLKLTPQAGADDIVYAWEDVKAMFNGGSRKRILSSVTSSRSSSTSNMETSKKSKMDPDSTTLVKPSYSSQYPSYNMFSPPGKPYPFGSVAGHHSFGMNFSHNKDMHTDNSNKSLMSSGLWGAQNSLAFPGYDFFWANTLALSRGSGLRNNYYPALTAKPAAMADPHFMKMAPNNDSGANRKMPAPTSHVENNASKASSQDRFSAFRPVGRPSVTEEDEAQEKHSAINLSTTEEEENEEIDVTDDLEDDKTNFSSDEERYGREEEEEEDESTLPAERDERRAEDVTAMQKGYSDDPARRSEERPATPTVPRDTEVAGVDLTVDKPGKEESGNVVADPHDSNNTEDKGEARLASDSDRPPETAPMDSGISETSDCEMESKELNGMSKEELYEQLKKEIETRRRIEREVILMKETFQEQAKREKSYRDEMAQQLQVVRETLSSELDLERKSRFSLQQKLKEAHDALHNFSCKMLASRHCEECSYKDAPMPR